MCLIIKTKKKGIWKYSYKIIYKIYVENSYVISNFDWRKRLIKLFDEVKNYSCKNQKFEWYAYKILSVSLKKKFQLDRVKKKKKIGKEDELN